MTLKLSFPKYRIRIPSPGQEGGGVFWNQWEDSSEREFLRVWEDPTKSVIVRALADDHNYFEIFVNPHGGEAEYTVKQGVAVSVLNVTREEFRSMLVAACASVVVKAEEHPETDTEFLYRYRWFRTPSDSWNNNCGWTDWEYCDEKKYNEIVYHIQNGQAAYQAQRIPVEPDRDICVDLKARGWDVPRYRYREQMQNGEYTNWVEITRDHLWKLKQSESDRRDVWFEYEVSRDGGNKWESL